MLRLDILGKNGTVATFWTYGQDRDELLQAAKILSDAGLPMEAFALRFATDRDLCDYLDDVASSLLDLAKKDDHPLAPEYGYAADVLLHIKGFSDSLRLGSFAGSHTDMVADFRQLFDLAREKYTEARSSRA